MAMKDSLVRFVLARNVISTSKQSKEGKQVLQQNFHVGKDDVTAGKKILNNFQTLKEANNLSNEIFNFVKKETLPLNNVDDRGYPASELFKLINELDPKIAKWRELRDKVADELPTAIAEDMAKKPGLVRAEDYPDPEKIRAMDIVYDYFPVSAGTSAFVDLADELLEKKRGEEQVLEETVKKDMFQKLHVAVTSAIEKLQNNKRLHTSILTNLKEFAEKVKTLNPTDDQIIDNLAQEVYNLGVNYSIDELREVAGTKEEVIEKASAIKKDLETYF